MFNLKVLHLLADLKILSSVHYYIKMFKVMTFFLSAYDSFARLFSLFYGLFSIISVKLHHYFGFIPFFLLFSVIVTIQLQVLQKLEQLLHLLKSNWCLSGATVDFLANSAWKKSFFVIFEAFYFQKYTLKRPKIWFFAEYSTFWIE